MGPIHRRAIEIPNAFAPADAYALAFAVANAPLGEKKETPAAPAPATAYAIAPATAYAAALANASANAPLGEKQMKRKPITVRSKCHLYQGEWGEEDLMACRAEWEHWKTKHEP